MRFRFIHAEKANYPLWLLCQTLRVNRQGYYSWLARGERAEKDHGDLDDAIKEVHKDNKRCYGTRRQKRELEKRGFTVARKTIRKRMVARG